MTSSSQEILRLLLRELFLSLFHVNSILSALAGNTPSLQLSASATVMLLVYVDVRICAENFLECNSGKRSGITLEGVMNETHSLFGIVRECAVQYIEKFSFSCAGKVAVYYQSP